MIVMGKEDDSQLKMGKFWDEAMRIYHERRRSDGGRILVMTMWEWESSKNNFGLYGWMLCVVPESNSIKERKSSHTDFHEILKDT